MTHNVFGTDGVRGRANTYPMTSELALRLGMVAGTVLTNGSHRHRVVIGKDTRLSGYMFESALVSGFTAVGMDVFQLGPMPTPAVAMLTRSLRADLGVMISASHNPHCDNGIKLFDAEGQKLPDEKEEEIERLLQSDLTALLSPPQEIGRATRIDSASERYVEFVKRTLPKELRFDGIRVVIDCANGAAYKVAPCALWELGAEVISIGVEPDGLNINRDCGSTSPGTLVRKVNEVRADIGIALDGDADRVIIVDEKGRIVDGDQLMAVIAESWLKQGRITGGGLVATVMSNLGLERHLERFGLSLARTQVGDRYVVEYMRQHGINIGGEQSGHIILSDFATTGDGLVAALQILAAVAESGKPVSEVCHRFDPSPQVLESIRCKNRKALENDTVLSAIEFGRSKLGTRGRLVVRPSGTEAVVRVMAEGDDEELLKSVVADIAAALSRVAEKDSLADAA
jgi:phosphoglucosamine mutase